MQHLTGMGSLEKVTTDEAVLKWAEDVRKRLDSDEELVSLRDRPVAVWSLAVAPDGRTVAIGYENGDIRLWRTAGR